MVRNALPSTSRSGRPKDTLLTPSTVPQPVFSRISFSASRVVCAAVPSALTVIVSVSKRISLLSIPYLAASARIRSAIFSRPSAVTGIPSSSSVRATRTPPYFCTSGKTASMTSCLPFTELIIAFPLYARSARSIAAASAVSSCSGRSVTACSSCTAWVSSAGSSTPGVPTFTSSTSAPRSSWVMASFST